MINVVKMLTSDEGLRYRVYKDTYGNHTVGIGFNMDSANARGVWIHADMVESFNNVYNNLVQLSVKSVSNLFNVCLSNTKQDLISIFPEFNTYPDYVQLALINIMFNIGKTSFSAFDTTIHMIKDKKFNEAADHLLIATKWAKQLPDRAKRVTNLMKGNYELYTSI